MRFHWLQHVEYEGLGSIAEWLSRRRYDISTTRFWKNEVLPATERFDALIVMGGSQSVYEEHLFPWLKHEKQFIARAIDASKPVLGICLGAQLIAEVLGAKVHPNTELEIGWFDIQRSANTHALVNIFPEHFTAFHWHGDCFTIPSGANPIGSSEICKTQGFVIDSNIIGLQFHLEMTEESISALVANGYDSVKQGPFVQNKEQLLTTRAHYEKTFTLLNRLLDQWIPEKLQQKTM